MNKSEQVRPYKAKAVWFLFGSLYPCMLAQKLSADNNNNITVRTAKVYLLCTYARYYDNRIMKTIIFYPPNNLIL